MPYSSDSVGIYAIVNEASGKCYIGQTRHLRKRSADHLNLLRRGIHPNPHLQNSFRRHGEDCFTIEVVAEVEDPEDLDVIEAAFLSGEAIYRDMMTYNIARLPQAAMAGRRHSEETRLKISQAKTGDRGHVTEEYRRKLSNAQRLRHARRPEFLDRVNRIVSLIESGLSYAETARTIGSDTSSVRKLFLKYRKKT